MLECWASRLDVRVSGFDIDIVGLNMPNALADGRIFPETIKTEKI
jgi:hypothetical protein